MEIAQLFSYISMVIFAIIAIRQFGGNYFYYFLILAIEDPLAHLLIKTIHFPQMKLHVLFSFFVLYSVIKLKEINKSILYFIPLSVVYLIASTYADVSSVEIKNQMRMFIGIMHTIILLVIIKRVIFDIKLKSTLNLFLFALALYESITVFKFIMAVLELYKGFLFFYLALFFQILLALFFIMFRDDNPKLLIKLSDPKGPLPE